MVTGIRLWRPALRGGAGSSGLVLLRDNGECKQLQHNPIVRAVDRKVACDLQALTLARMAIARTLAAEFNQPKG